MANRLACEIPHKIAAVGIIIAGMPKVMKDKCAPASHVSVLIMNGTKDPIVPYNGGAISLMKAGLKRGEDISTEDTFLFWLQKAGKRTDNIAVEELPDTAPEDGTRVYRKIYKGETAEVNLYTIDGGGHTWPGGRQYLFQVLVGKTSMDIDATSVIWEFFDRNPKR